MSEGYSTDYDSKERFISYESMQQVGGESRRDSLRSLIREFQSYVFSHLDLLPSVDSTISRLYYLDEMSQDQISQLLDISQAAVSRRLTVTLARLKFLIRMPSLDRVKVRKDFELLFPEALMQSAFFFYWELSQNRVKNFIKTSQSGAANKLIRICDYLEELSAVSDDEIEAVEDCDLRDELIQKKYLALVYIDHFRIVGKRNTKIMFLYKKNDDLRTDSIIRGEDIFNI